MPGYPLLVLATAASLVVVAGCGDDDVIDEECSLDEGSFRDLAVSAGLTPTFSWCGALADFLLVEDTDTTNDVGDVWSVDCDGPDRCIAPPVEYGETPAGTSVRQELLPLQPGEGYRVCIFSDAHAPIGSGESSCREFQR